LDPQKKVTKILISIILGLLFDLSLKDDVNVPSKKERNKKENLFFVSILSATDEKAGSGSVSQWCGSGSVPKCYGSTTLVRSLKTITSNTFGVTFKGQSGQIRMCRLAKSR
jgi:hypothetical protein